MNVNLSIELIHLDDFDLFIDHADPDIGHPIAILREYEPPVAGVILSLLKSGKSADRYG